MLLLEHISKRFANSPICALEKVNLRIKKGDYCIILGSNGSGKSTLFKLISGELSPSKGNIIFDGHDITKLPIYQRAKYISSVSQNLDKGTISEMSVLENVILSNMRMQSATYKLCQNYHNEVIQLLDNLNLAAHINTTMVNLSGGQRQAVACLMAMHPKPDLLLLDEHTSALDPASRKLVMSFTDSYIQTHNITTLMITHNIQDAIDYGNRLIILDQGTIKGDFDLSSKQIMTYQDILGLLY